MEINKREMELFINRCFNNDSLETVMRMINYVGNYTNLVGKVYITRPNTKAVRDLYNLVYVTDIQGDYLLIDKENNCVVYNDKELKEHYNCYRKEIISSLVNALDYTLWNAPEKYKPYILALESYRKG